MINTINQALEKRGQKFIDNFFDSNLIITEKLDLYRLVFTKSNGILNFFKKDNQPIDEIELILNDIWVEPINIIKSKLELIPEDLYFGISFASLTTPKIIPYELNNLIITDITYRQNGKVIKKFNKEEVQKIADSLNFLPMPIIFEGILNKDQKDILFKYYNKETEMILSDIIKQYFKPFTNFPLVKGLILENNNSLIQIESYEYNTLADSYKKEFTTNRVFYDLIIINLINYLKTFDFNISFKTDSYSKRYIELINIIFLNFIKIINVGSIDKQYLNPKYLNDSINVDLINNQLISDYFNENESYKYIYKIILNSLRKEKSPYAMIDKNNAMLFNQFVKKINEIIK